jgi:GTP-binding protein
VKAHDPALLERPRLVVATKRDVVVEPDPLPALCEEARGLGLEVVAVSAVTGEGLLALKRRLLRLLDEVPAATVAREERA